MNEREIRDAWRTRLTQGGLKSTGIASQDAALGSILGRAWIKMRIENSVRDDIGSITEEEGALEFVELATALATPLLQPRNGIYNYVTAAFLGEIEAYLLSPGFPSAEWAMRQRAQCARPWFAFEQELADILARP